MRALVTGGNGLIGANLVRTLIREGHEVRPLVRAGADLSSLDGVPVTPQVGDVLNTQSIRDAADGCDVVFHTAVPYVYGAEVDADLVEVAVTGTANVLSAAAASGSRRVVVTSSSVVFGYRMTPEVVDTSGGLTDGHDQPVYVAAKIHQDRAAVERGARLGIDVVLVCPTVCVGPHATRLGPSNAMIVQVLVDPVGVTYQGGGNVVAVQDVARGHLLAATHGRPGQRYLLGGENLTWEQVHNTVAELAGLPHRGVRLNHTLAYLAAGAEELRARLAGRPAVTSREQSSMVGRYYWYRHDQATQLGYTPRPARRALAEALAWLVASRHVSRETRTRLHLHADVFAARRALEAAERELVNA
ncbi:MAG: NAD-dependent epimerase/dehydratase family protein [Actinobacteria bacterium]|nr:NAD-dependent epimerase/dehydratase family protein [Actinomycetota bacterium]